MYDANKMVHEFLTAKMIEGCTAHDGVDSEILGTSIKVSWFIGFEALA
jgi:hypothetical protein